MRTKLIYYLIAVTLLFDCINKCKTTMDNVNNGNKRPMHNNAWEFIY